MLLRAVCLVSCWHYSYLHTLHEMWAPSLSELSEVLALHCSGGERYTVL